MFIEELRDIQLSSAKAQTLQSQLYQAIRSRIIEGRYPAGLQLPASRTMADELGVGRNTVLLTLEQLKAEGYIDTRPGAGTYVTHLLPEHFTPLHANAKVTLPNLKHNLNNLPLDHYFAPGVPDLDAFPHAIWQKLIRLHTGRTLLMGFNCAQGYAPLRQAIAEYLRVSRACQCHDEQIIITDGAQQAISLAAQVLLKDGETVYVENPGYIRARSAFLARGCRLKGIDVDELGIIPKLLPNNANGKVLFMTPTHQYPLGGALPLARRLEVLQWLKEKQVWLLEDDYDSEFHYDQKPIAVMQSLGFAESVIYMGSFSKVLYPGLRLGYLVVPEKLVSEFIKAKSNMSGESSLLKQAVTCDFLTEGHFSRHLRKMRKRYHLKLLVLLEHCQNLPGVKKVISGSGMHLVLLFNSSKFGIDQKITDLIKAKGINVRPLSMYYLDRPRHQGLVLGFANASHQQIVAGMMVIRECLREH